MLRSAIVQGTAVALVVLLAVLGLWQVSRMDGRFFQRSSQGAKALVLYLFGDYGSAAQAYRAHFKQRSWTGYPGSPSEEALLRGKPPDARRLAEGALKTNPNDIEALLTLGELDLDQGQVASAHAAFARVLAFEDDEYDALLLTSIAFARQGDYGRAIDTIKRGLRYDRTGRRTSVFLDVLETTGDLRALPANTRPNCLLAHYYRYLRIFDPLNARPAIRYARRAIQAGDRPDDAYYTIGIIHLLRDDDPDAALEAFQQAVRANPRNAQALRGIGRFYSRRADLANELRMYRAAFAAAPDDLFYARQLGVFLRDQLGDYYDALSLALAYLAMTSRSTLPRSTMTGVDASAIPTAAILAGESFSVLSPINPLEWLTSCI
jgi:tetratricopeptide (TPR) repeat protein